MKSGTGSFNETGNVIIHLLRNVVYGLSLNMTQDDSPAGIYEADFIFNLMRLVNENISIPIPPIIFKTRIVPVQ